MKEVIIEDNMKEVIIEALYKVIVQKKKPQFEFDVTRPNVEFLKKWEKCQREESLNLKVKNVDKAMRMRARQ